MRFSRIVINFCTLAAQRAFTFTNFRAPVNSIFIAKILQLSNYSSGISISFLNEKEESSNYIRSLHLTGDA